MKTVVVCLGMTAAWLVLSAPAHPEPLDHYFEQGNAYYSGGDYTAAIDTYEKILKGGQASPELYYNLGNAYFRQGQLGQAIMNYIRARRLDPRDDDIRTNLEFARQFAIDKIEVTEETIVLDYVNRFFDAFTFAETAWLAGLLYALLALIFLAGRVYRWIPLPAPILVIVVVTFLLSGVFAGVKLDRDILTHTGVVVADQCEVKNGPGQDYNTQFTAHAGLTFTIEREESGYCLVSFENRLKGWIDRSSVAGI